MNSLKLSYRAEIDGLRAIAVVSVILYHAQMVLFGRDWFEGGFIGVDIFFVISGYLITRIILSELESKGSFSFLNFYERRARRILPMLFVVIFVSVPYAWEKLLPSDFVEYAESILASLFFGSNFFFYFSTTEYGADSALLKPFLHTWSLGVEEQFYLVFPILAIVAFKFFRKNFLTILFGLSLLSLQFSELMEMRNSSLNFYLPFSRFWELAIGSILAYRELYYKPSNEGLASKSLSIIGLYLIIYSILFFDSKTPHPSFHTLIPIIGAALIIGFASKDELVGKVLGSKPFVWIGLISYSAYLWHFPVFAFNRIGKEPTNYEKFEWVVLTIVISVLTYVLVEKQFRIRSRVSSKKFWLIVLACSYLIMCFSLIAINTEGFRYRYPIIIQKTDLGQKPWFALKDRKTGRPCHNLKQSCYFNSDADIAKGKIAIIGDSDAAAMAMNIVPKLRSLGYDLLLNTGGGCPFYLGGDIFIKDKKNGGYRLRGCSQELQLARLRDLQKFSPNVILHIGRLNELGNRKNIRNLNDEYGLKPSDDAQVLIRVGQKELSSIAPTIYVQSLPRVTEGKSPLNHVKSVLNGLTDVVKITKALDDNPFVFEPSARNIKQWGVVEETLGTANLFKTWSYFCEYESGLVCRGFDNDGLYYFDKAHPSEYAVHLFFEDLFSMIEVRGSVSK